MFPPSTYIQRRNPRTILLFGFVWFLCSHSCSSVGLFLNSKFRLKRIRETVFECDSSLSQPTRLQRSACVWRPSLHAICVHIVSASALAHRHTHTGKRKYQIIEHFSSLILKSAVLLQFEHAETVYLHDILHDVKHDHLSLYFWVQKLNSFKYLFIVRQFLAIELSYCR